MICCRSISKDLTFFDLIALKDNGALVDTGTLVGTFEFQDIVFIDAFSIITSDEDLVTTDILDRTSVLSKDADTGVNSDLIFHPRTNDWRLGLSRGTA